jgi:hypothetical protein
MSAATHDLRKKYHNSIFSKFDMEDMKAIE